MPFVVPDAFVKHVSYPVWEVYERAERLREWRRLEASQFFSRCRIEELQWSAVHSVLQYAIANCHYYASYDRTAAETRATWQKLPVVTKDEVRSRRDEMIARSVNPNRVNRAKTGGSTGVSLDLVFDKRCQEYRNAAAIRSDRWSGWDLGCPRGALWGNPPTPRTAKELVRHHFLDRLVYLDTVALDEPAMERFVRQIKDARVHHLFGHAHSLFVFARFVADRGTDLRISGIVSTSMMLLPQERRVIEETFGCPVTDRYGCEEVGLIACECEQHRGLHINSEHVLVECLDATGRPCLPGEHGRLVITDLVNRAMPLIRYEVGDVAALSRDECSCGRGLPLIERLVGRTADFLVRPDGIHVAGVSLVERTLTAIPGLEQLQLIQDAPTHVVANVVPDKEFDELTSRHLSAELSRALGANVVCDIRIVDRLEQERNGKYRFAICRIPSQWQHGQSQH